MARAPAKVWAGPDTLRRLLVPLDSIKPHPRNPRRGDVAAIAASLERFGQMRPIVVWAGKSYIVAGNHTWLGAGELSWTHIAAVSVEMGEDEALGYLLADNRTADLGRYDDDARLSILSALAQRGKLVGTGYSPDDIDDLIAARDAVLRTDPQPFTGGYSETDEEIAAREARRAEGLVLREVVLMLTGDQYDNFGQYVKMLRKELGTEGVGETVYAAMKRAAEAL